MRRIAAFLVTALLLFLGTGASPAHAATTLCGRPGYPSGTQFNAASIVDPGLWSSLRARDAFANGTEGVGSIELRVPDPGRLFVVTLEEVLVREYVGGGDTNRTAIALRVTEETGGGQTVAAHNFTLLDFGGKDGGNLTLVAWLDGGSLELFWRWAYLVCSAEFPNLYYVFHGRTDGGGIDDDNALVYFEATRPRRSPPVDLIILVIAGAAASAIFLYARRALKTKEEPGSERDDRTVK